MDQILTTILLFSGKNDSYIPFTTTKTWREAQKFCREHYTDLASVRDESENSKIFSLFPSALSSKSEFRVWIGLFRDAWTWSDQSNSSFRFRKSDQPNNPNPPENCAAVWTNGADFGQWEDLKYDTPLPFVCSGPFRGSTTSKGTTSGSTTFTTTTKATTSGSTTFTTTTKATSSGSPSVSTTTKATSSRPTDVTTVNAGSESSSVTATTKATSSGPANATTVNTGSSSITAMITDTSSGPTNVTTMTNDSIKPPVKLVLINQTKTWKEARSYCRENHVDLVSVTSEEIQVLVRDMVNGSSDSVWVGLRYICAIKTWIWVRGEFICYQNWAPGYGTAEEDCSGGDRTGAVQAGGQWVSLNETLTRNFICTSDEGL